MRDRRVRVKAALMALATAFIVAGGAASALADESIVVKVPFAFIVGDRQMPAVDYVVTEATNDASVLWISSRDGRQAVCTLTIPVDHGQATTRAALVFDKFENHYFLARMVPAVGTEREIVLTPARMEGELKVLAAD